MQRQSMKSLLARWLFAVYSYIFRIPIEV